MEIIGILLGLIAIGLFIWLKKEQQMNFDLHEGDIEASKHAYMALQEEFSNYQVETDRKIANLEKTITVKSKEQDRNLNRLAERINPPTLSKLIRKVVGHIEFAKPLDKK